MKAEAQSRPPVDDRALYRALLFSVYYHTEPLNPVRPEHSHPSLAPIPLADAVTMLADPRRPWRESVRPRVVVRLVLGHEYQLLGRLLTPDELERLRVALPELERTWKPELKKLSAPAAGDRKEEKLFNAIHAILNAPAPRYVSKWVSVDQYKVTTVHVSFDSTRSFDELSRALDPRNWSTAFPDFFAASYPVRLGSGGTFHEVPNADPSEPFELFECVQWNWNLMTLSQGRNLLNMGPFAPSSSGLAYEYSLYTCLSSIMGVLEEHGGIDVDHGPISVVPNELGSPRVTIQKSVRFTDPIVNAVGPVVLGMWLDHVALDALG